MQENITVTETHLALPPCEMTLRRQEDGQVMVYDRLRKKFVAFTPEERVRQCFTAYLIDTLGYPAHLMANEVGLTHNGTRRRCDTVIYDNTARPLAIVEYKASTVPITEKVFDQIVRYNMVMDVRWLIVSNGLSHYCCRVLDDGSAYQFVKSLPGYDEMVAPVSDQS